MKKQYTASVVGGIALAVALTLMLTLTMSSITQATNTPGRDITDHALLSPINEPTGAVGCKSDKSFTVYITMLAVANTTLRVVFVNATTNLLADAIEFPLVAGQIVNITQAAGGTPTADTHLVVSGTTSGGLSGWMSISTQSGAAGFDATDIDYCRTYATEALAIADD